MQVSGGAQLIYAAPCCHQQLQRQLRQVARAARHPNDAMLPAPASSAAASATTASTASTASTGASSTGTSSASATAASSPSAASTSATATATATSASPSAASLAMITSDNLIRQRIGDTLTDHLRARLLRLLGYRVDVVEFVDLAHSPKNLLLRAVRDGSAGARDDGGEDGDGDGDGDGEDATREGEGDGDGAGAAAAAAAAADGDDDGGGGGGGGSNEAALLEYRALTAAWGITPHLELLLARRAADIDARAASAANRDDGSPPNEFELELAARVRELGLRAG